MNNQPVMKPEEIVRTVAIAFERNDAETILTHVTDDIEWHMLGSSTISGKENLRKFFNDHPDMKILSITKDHFVFDGETAVIDGDVQCTDALGNIYDMFYCDLYELEGSKIKKLISYTVNKRK